MNNDLKVINANFLRFPIEVKIKSISPPLLRGRKRRGEDQASWTALQYWPFESLDPRVSISLLLEKMAQIGVLGETSVLCKHIDDPGVFKLQV